MQRMLTFQVRRIRVNPLSGALSLALKTHRHLFTSCLLPQTCLERIPPQLHLKSALPWHRLRFVTLLSAGTNSPPSVTLAGSTLCSFVAGVICLVCLQSAAFPVSKPPWGQHRAQYSVSACPPAPRQVPMGAHLSVHGWGGAQVGGDVVKIMGGRAPAPPTPGGEGSLVPRRQRLSQPLYPIFPPNKRFLLSPHRAEGKGVVGPICRPDPAGLADLSLLVSWPHPLAVLPAPRQALWGAGPGKRHLRARSQLQHNLTFFNARKKVVSSVALSPHGQAWLSL